MFALYHLFETYSLPGFGHVMWNLVGNVLWYKILEYLEARYILHKNPGHKNKELLAQ